MRAIDFEYDGRRLSDFGYVICDIDSNSSDTISAGSQITFSTVPVYNGARHFLAYSTYSEYITAEFSICKDPCDVSSQDDMYITVDEQRDLARWLNRKRFHKFRLIDDEYIGYFFEGSFNIDRIEYDGNTVGLHLTLTTNRPFALYDEVIFKFKIESAGQSKTIVDMSDEMGFIYPEVQIVCQQGGDLSIANDMSNETTVIKNCVSGETITIKDLIISTDSASHQKTIMNDFNYVFPKICNAYNDISNKYTFSLPCKVTMKYNPIRKVSV